MQHYTSLLFLFCLCSHLTLSGEIIEADDLDQTTEYFDRLTPHSLLLWDVDLTLILPTDRIMHPDSKLERRQLRSEYLNELSEEEEEWLFSEILFGCSYGLVDQKLPDIISNMQNKNIPTIALTALNTSPYGVIESMEEWRFNQLKLLGIDFSNTFPEFPRVDWFEETEEYIREPVFFQGILCTDGIPKGFVLEAFLTHLELTPDFILFIDDKYSYLKSVEEIMDEMGIPFVGIHYHAAKGIKTTVDWKIARHQYRVLADEGIWLSDDTALEEIFAGDSPSDEETQFDEGSFTDETSLSNDFTVDDDDTEVDDDTELDEDTEADGA